MKNNLNAELVRSAIEHDWSYLRPVSSFLSGRAVELIVLLAILAFVGSLLWLASIGAF